VNYVQVTGAATGGSPTISAQGSDSAIPIALQSKGTSPIVFNNGSSQRQFRIDGTGVGTNYFGVASSATAFSPVFGVASQSTDTNVAAVFQSKGTGAIDLAAGSSGVNISNGGTVTALTRTATGTGYTSVPSVAVSAPTTAGGVQATATVSMGVSTFAVANGGTGYTLNDVLTVVGGTGTVVVVTASAVSAGVVTAVTYSSGGSYTVTPTNPAATTGGTGTGCTLNITYTINNSFTITNAGSGYVEQPTVTFSGGGGSGAAAFATIGSTVTFKSLNDITVQLPSGPAMSIVDSGNPGTGAYLQFSNGSTSNAIQRAIGTNTNLGIYWLTKGTGSHSFNTNNSTSIQQMVVTHTASAVNYVQVTGAATGSAPNFQFTGSDANVLASFGTKGTGSFSFYSGGLTNRQVRIDGASAAVNYLDFYGSVAGSAPSVRVGGTDTNIDLTLTPKGTGNVRFGTYTGTILTPTGYIEIKDSGGTIRRLLVG
jgi:hypothetical protein